MTQVNIPDNFNPGAFPDRPDHRDYQYEEIAMGASPIDWEDGYNVLDEIAKLGGTIKAEDQNGSLSCVGQAFSKYAEVLNVVETKGLADLSAKSIYEQIFLPSGGAYLRDGAKAIVDGGVASEIDVPSYRNGKPPTEEFMRTQTINEEIKKSMLVYQAKEYRTVGPANADLVAMTIRDNWGAVTGVKGDNAGWSGNFVVLPPTTNNPWGHAIYLIGFGQDDNGKYFDFINSWGRIWGKNGLGRMYFEGYNFPNNAFVIWTLVDKPNLINNKNDMRFIKTKSNKHIYLIDNKGLGKIMIIDMPTLTAMNGGVEIVDETIFNSYPTKGTLVWTDRLID